MPDGKPSSSTVTGRVSSTFPCGLREGEREGALLRLTVGGKLSLQRESQRTGIHDTTLGNTVLSNYSKTKYAEVSTSLLFCFSLTQLEQ